MGTILKRLKDENAILLCTKTGKAYMIGPPDGDTIMLLTTEGSYRSCKESEITFSREGGYDCLAAETTLNGYGYSKLKAVIYLPAKLPEFE